MLDKFKDECGVFGVYNHKDASAFTVLGLHSLQHRGQESAGIVSYDGTDFHKHLAFGKVGEKFNRQEVIDKLKGSSSIGHNRYSTSGDKGAYNIQPIYAQISLGEIALAHNGNLTNAGKIKKALVGKGSIFSTTMDSEVIVHLIATSGSSNIEEGFIKALGQVEGGFSVIMLHKDGIMAARDPHGIRPLSLGILDDAFVLASETVAFDIIGAKFVRDIKAGEVITIDKRGVNSSFPFPQKPSRFCVFEYIYFSRPDSILEGRDVYLSRKAMGRELAKESLVDADIVVPVPDSGVPAALGYSEESGLPFDLGIIRNHYVGRTFIEPTDSIRNLGVKLKHNANPSVVKGKRVILIDDSIVRGTTSRKIVDMVRQAGATEVHLRISSPPTTDPCFYGVDTPSKDKLIASKMSIDEIAKFVGADSLAFLSVDGLYRAVRQEKRRNDSPQFCDACFTGQYPIAIK
jgi:amidophosphoribosyltransferase